MATANFTIKPEDGWTVVTSGGAAFIKIRSTTGRHPFYVTSGSSAPADTDVGFKVECNEFCVNVSTTEEYYVRTTDNQPQGCTISVFTIAPA